jgi:hypothetical protein
LSPVRRALVSISDSQHGRFAERSARNLKPDPKSVLAFASLWPAQSQLLSG